jgi:L-fuconolactonase
MPDFPIIDAHVHLTDVKNLGYGWTKNAPVLNRTVLPADLFRAAAPVQIEKFVFVEVPAWSPLCRWNRAMLSQETLKRSPG